MGTSSDLMSPTPAWSCFTLALGVFLHQTLDALDGKQARRTKTSSPLGAIFDHGCDIFTITLVSVASVALCRCGSGLQSIAIVTLSAQLSQFLYLWWEYHFHVFCSNPGYGAGVTEAQCIVIVFALLTGIFGADFWVYDVFELVAVKSRGFEWVRQFFPSALPLNRVVVGVVLASNLLADARMIHTAVPRFSEGKRRAGYAQIVGFLVFLGFECLFYLGVVDLLGGFPLPGFILLTIVYGILALRLLLSATAQKRYSAVQLPAIPFVGLALIVIYQWTAAHRTLYRWELPVVAWLQKHLLRLIWATAIGYGAFLVVMVYVTVKQISRYLGVQCFTIAAKKPSEKTTTSPSVRANKED